MSRRRIPVLIGDVKVAGADAVLFTVGLGSCVAIVLYDTARRLGGLAHAMLPSPASGRRPAPAGRFASTAVHELLGQMEAAGAQRRAIRARLAGGASMFESLLTESGRRLGWRNVEAARGALHDAGIPVDGEDVGGGHGRSVYLHIREGHVIVSSVHHPDVVL
jgi:chemotaxis protein CheD